MSLLSAILAVLRVLRKEFLSCFIFWYQFYVLCSLLWWMGDSLAFITHNKLDFTWLFSRAPLGFFLFFSAASKTTSMARYCIAHTAEHKQKAKRNEIDEIRNCLFAGSSLHKFLSVTIKIHHLCWVGLSVRAEGRGSRWGGERAWFTRIRRFAAVVRV